MTNTKITAQKIVDDWLKPGTVSIGFIDAISEALTIAAQEAREEGIKKGYIDGRRITDSEAREEGYNAGVKLGLGTLDKEKAWRKAAGK
jgi:ethanolamine utilization microcompartment shell protein EutS